MKVARIHDYPNIQINLPTYLGAGALAAHHPLRMKETPLFLLPCSLFPVSCSLCFLGVRQ
jgi:hypothetical protein